MKRVKIDEIVVSDEMYDRVQNLMEAYNERNIELPTTIKNIISFVINTWIKPR